MSGPGREHGVPDIGDPSLTLPAAGPGGNGGVRPGRAVTFAGLLILSVAALCLRGSRLGDRPMHNDEACQAIKFTQLLDCGYYRYDPTDHHGPTLYYLTLPLTWITGARDSTALNESTLRCVPLLFSIGTILLLGILYGAVSRRTLVLAAVFAVSSPALTYFSRYYIQESSFVFFTMLLVAAGWRYICTGRAGWASLCGLAAGSLLATKETAVLVFAAVAVALACLAVLCREERTAFFRFRFRWSHLAWAAISATAVFCVFFSSFFTNPRGVVDAVTAFVQFAGRAQGSGHEKGVGYYFHLLTWHKNGGFWWGEGSLFVPCLAGVWIAWRRPANLFMRFASILGLALLFLYGLIPYKTPWLMLGVIQLATLPAAFAFTEAWRRFPSVAVRTTLLALLAVALGSLWRQNARANGRFAADERNPWVYSHTSRDCLSGVKVIREAMARSPDGPRTLVKIMSPEYWPLPWYLRDCKQIGYWTSMPDDPVAPIMVVSADEAAALEHKLGSSGSYSSHIFGLRPGMILVIYIRQP